MSPLICFDIIEWHRLERVLRQFRMQQRIHPPCLIDMELHLVDRRGQHQYDWMTFHAQYISLWATLLSVLRQHHLLLLPWIFMIHICSDIDVSHNA